MRRGLVVCVLAAACGSDSGGGGPIPIESLQASYHAYYCNEAVRCGLVSDLATCGKLRLGSTTISPDLVAAVEAGVVTYDGAAAGECLAGITATCDRSLAGSDRDAPLACDEMFTGTLAANAPCALDQECVSGLCSAASCTTAGTPAGYCYAGTATTRPALGESCSSNSRCIASYCDYTTYTCAPYLAQGSPCTADGDCQLGLACPQNATTRTCQPLAPTGGACTSDGDCKSLGDFCGAGGKCTAFALAGDPCASDADCSPVYRCDTTSSTCVLRPTLGDPCSGSQDCVDTSYCDVTTTTCTAPKADGVMCTSSSQCQSNYCDFTTGVYKCATPPVCY